MEVMASKPKPVYRLLTGFDLPHGRFEAGEEIDTFPTSCANEWLALGMIELVEGDK